MKPKLAHPTKFSLPHSPSAQLTQLNCLGLTPYYTSVVLADLVTVVRDHSAMDVGLVTGTPVELNTGVHDTCPPSCLCPMKKHIFYSMLSG